MLNLESDVDVAARAVPVAFLREIEALYNRELALLERVIRETQGVLEVAFPSGGRTARRMGSFSPYRSVVLMLLAKSFKTLQAIDVLFRQGYAQQCLVLERTLAESLINLRFIKGNSDRYAPRFIAASRVEAWNTYQDGASFFANPPRLQQDEEDALKALYEEAVKSYPFMTGRGKKRGLWTNKTVRQRAEAIGQPQLYVIVKRASEEVHSSASGVGRYFYVGPEGMAIDGGPNVPGTATGIIGSTGLFLDLLGDANRLLRLRQGGTIKGLGRACIALQRDLLPTP